MQTYDRVQGNETETYIKARIFDGAKQPEAELHHGGPGADGTKTIAGPMSVPQALERGKNIAAQNGVLFLVQMDGAAWDQAWGMLRV